MQLDNENNEKNQNKNDKKNTDTSKHVIANTLNRAPSIYIANGGRMCLVDARLTLKLDRQLKQHIIVLASLKGHDDPAEYALHLLIEQLKNNDMLEINGRSSV